MSDGTIKTGKDLRVHDRTEIADPVTIEFAGQPMTGSGENISVQGIYFTTDGAIPVNVRIGDGSIMRGELVRAESMGDGRVGVAVRFCVTDNGRIAD